MGILGVNRANSDIDFLIKNSQKEIIRELMRKLNYDSKLKTFVVHLEDLIILKLQSIKLDTSRKVKDESDILNLLNL